MKNFRAVLAPALTDQSRRVRQNNSDKAAAVSFRAAEFDMGTDAEPGQPGPLPRSLDPADLRLWADFYGARFADTLVSDPRWPRCNQYAAMRRAEVIVRRAICGMAAILDSGDADLATHVPIIASTMLQAYQASLPGILTFKNEI
jgi:hypothetical protein